MAFFIQWFWCVLGFLAGSAVAWAGVMVSVKRTGADDAYKNGSGSAEIGAR